MPTFFIDSASIDSLIVTGSLSVTSNAIITGSLISSTNFTGSLLGTASLALTVGPSTASFVAPTSVFGPLGAGSVLSSSFSISSSLSITTSTATQTEKNHLLVYRALGSAILEDILDIPFPQLTLSANMLNGTAQFLCLNVPTRTTLTGVKYFSGTTTGSFTANNYNGFGLYTYSAGTLTLVASSSNDTTGNLWRVANPTMASRSFAAQYTANPGTYYLTILYSASSVTTAPTMLCHPNTLATALFRFDFQNSARLNGLRTSQTTLPTSLSISTFAVTNTVPYMAVY